MAELPSGTVTFLLTDVEGSTALWEEAPEAMRAALARHDALFEAAMTEHGGVHIRPRGEDDSHFAVFPSASGAVAAAIAIQRAFAAEPWPTPRPITVRMGLHTGEAELRDGDYDDQDHDDHDDAVHHILRSPTSIRSSWIGTRIWSDSPTCSLVSRYRRPSAPRYRRSVTAHLGASALW